jgi:hypothetical protein
MRRRTPYLTLGGLTLGGLTLAGLTLAGLLLTANSPAMAATLTVADLAPNDLVVTEYLANPIGISDTSGEYFEVYNTTLEDIDLAGLVVRDDGSNTFTVSSLVVTAGGFTVFANSDGAALGLSPSYVYGSAMSLTNGDDEIGLYRPDDTLINKVVYSDGDSFGAGIAHELDVLSASLPTVTVGPAAGSNFVAATAMLNLGNFGSPGAAGNTLLAAPAVPLPAGVWLLSSALAVLTYSRKRKDPASAGS